MSAAHLSPEELDLIRQKLDYAYCNGLVMGTRAPQAAPAHSDRDVQSYRTASHVPIASEPYDFPKELFQNALRLGPLFNKLMHSIASDTPWLQRELKVTAQSDEFTRNLLHILNTITAEQQQEQQSVAHQRAVLGILRSDYMVHNEPAAEGDHAATAAKPRQKLLQVEINTIASSFGALSSRLADMQRHFHGGSHRHVLNKTFTVPPNGAADCVVEGLAAAHYEYLRQTGTAAGAGTGAGGAEVEVEVDAEVTALLGSPVQRRAAAPPCLPASPARPSSRPALPVAVVMVVQGGEHNFADQRPVEYALWARFGITLLRSTLAELHAEAVLQDAPMPSVRPTAAPAAPQQYRELQFRGHVVSVVYYRAGYTPTDYPGGGFDGAAGNGAGVGPEWAARLLVERSFAIKCPSVALHLAGCKKVQQLVAGVVRIPCPDGGKKTVTRSIMETQFGLSGPEAADLQDCFAGLWSLEECPKVTAEGSQVSAEEVAESAAALERLKARVRTHPSEYVLKPQREGGGNNYYGAAMVAALDPPAGVGACSGAGGMTQKQLDGFILMQRIHPPAAPVVLLKANEATAAEHCISELGVFGVFLDTLRDKSEAPPNSPSSPDGAAFPDLNTFTPINRCAGYLLRIKPSNVDEGGLAAGYSVLGVPNLV